MQLSWYTIRTKPNKEFVAALNLENQGYETFFPKIIKTIRHARKTTTAQRPFFTGYLFIRLSQFESKWHSIAGTYGTIGPVKFGDQYPIIPNHIIDRLRGLENSSGFVDTTPFDKKFSPGQKVRLIAGELEGLEGIFFAQNGADRSLILLQFLGRSVKTTAPLHALQAV